MPNTQTQQRTDNSTKRDTQVDPTLCMDTYCKETKDYSLMKAFEKQFGGGPDASK